MGWASRELSERVFKMDKSDGSVVTVMGAR